MTCQAGTRTFNTPGNYKRNSYMAYKTGDVQYQITVLRREIFKTKNVIQLLKPSFKSTESYICKLFIYKPEKIAGIGHKIMVATGQEMAREKPIFQGQEKVREFYFESGKIDTEEKSGKIEII